MKRGTETEPIKINLLRLDLTKIRLDVVHAMDAAIGLETTSSMATRHGAFAAINAGFFRLDKSIFAGDAAGVLMINRKLLSETYGNRTALGIMQGGLGNTKEKNKPVVVIGHFTFYGSRVEFAQLTYSGSVVFGKSLNYEVTGINRQRKKDDTILFTPEFHHTSLTDEDGIEIIVRNAKVVQIIDKKGSNLIPSDGYILSASGKARDWVLQNVKIGERVERKLNIDTLGYENRRFFREYAEDIVGGVPQLIKNGKIEITWEQEKSSKSFVETRHPRTAVAKLKDGKFLMVTVDGRQKESVGMNLNELAALLLELGAVNAMNLDGGGSTTMFAGGKVVNNPSDKEGERKVSDAILVFPRKRN
jgi:hypothetical protein